MYTWPGTLWYRVSVWYVQWSRTDSGCSHKWGRCTCRERWDSKTQLVVRKILYLNGNGCIESTTVQVYIPFISCPMMRCVFDAVRHRVHLPVLHDHLHPQCCLSLKKHALLHPLKQHHGLFNWSVSPGWWKSVVALQFFPLLVTHIRMTPEGRQRERIRHYPPACAHLRMHTQSSYTHLRIRSTARS